MLTQGAYGAPENLTLQGSLGMQWSRQLWDEEPENQLLLEPALRGYFPNGNTAWFSAKFVRPLDPYRDLAVPRIALGGKHALNGWLSIWAAAQLIDVGRWSIDGFQSRYLAGGEIQYSLGGGVRLVVEAAPFIHLDEYRQAADGRDLSAWGFREQVTLRWTLGILEVELQGLMEQRSAGVWRNEYGLRERLGIRPWDLVFFGVSHEYVASAIDDSTGRVKRLSMWDARTSRVGAFAEVRL